jgi:putative membrane protein
METLFSSLKLDIWILQVIAMLITAFIMPGFTVSGPISALIAVVSLGFLNNYLWDAALFFSIPDSLTIHALTLVFANGILFWVLVKVLPGIDTKGLFAPFIVPILFTIISIGLNEYADKIQWSKLFTSVKEIIFETKETLKNENDSIKPSTNINMSQESS